MAFQDGPKVYRINKEDIGSSGLSEQRQQEYIRLLSELPHNITIWIDENHVVKFSFETGGDSLVTGSEWSNGIEFISEDFERYGHLIKSSKEINLGIEAIYLIPLENHWFIFHEQY